MADVPWVVQDQNMARGSELRDAVAASAPSAWTLWRPDLVRLAGVLALSSLASMALLAFRIYYSGAVGYFSLTWDVFLGWLPLIFAAPIPFFHRRGRWGMAAALGLGCLWLLFFPNAPYLLTEFMHLHPEMASSQKQVKLLANISPHGSVPLWYDVILIAFCAWNGLMIGFISLGIIQRLISRGLGRAWGWAMAVLCLTLGSFGISLGRFERWNSWDLFKNPSALLHDIWQRVAHPIDNPRTTAATLGLTAFLLLAYLTLIALMRLGPPDAER